MLLTMFCGRSPDRLPLCCFLASPRESGSVVINIVHGSLWTRAATVDVVGVRCNSAEIVPGCAAIAADNRFECANQRSFKNCSRQLYMGKEHPDFSRATPEGKATDMYLSFFTTSLIFYGINV